MALRGGKIALLDRDLRAHAPQIGAPLGGIAGGAAQPRDGLGIGAAQIAHHQARRGDVGHDPCFEQRALDRAGERQRGLIFLQRGGELAHFLIRIAAIVVRRQRQLGIVGKGFVGEVVIIERARIIARLEIDRPDVLEHHRLAAGFTELGVERVRIMEQGQRRLDVPLIADDRSLRLEQIGVELGARLGARNGGDRPIDDRHRFLDPVEPHQRLALKPLTRGGGGDARGAGRGLADRDRLARVGERDAGIGHHRALGGGNLEVERRCCGSRGGRGGWRSRESGCRSVAQREADQA